MLRHEYVSLAEALLEHQITLSALMFERLITDGEYREESARVRLYHSRLRERWELVDKPAARLPE